MFTLFNELRGVMGPNPSSSNPSVQSAVELITRHSNADKLGFFGRDKTDAIETAVRLLAEHGRTVDDSEKVKIVDLLKDLDERRQTRKRVLAQTAITGVLLVIALAVIFGLIPTTEGLNKASYALLGTIAGFWLK